MAISERLAALWAQMGQAYTADYYFFIDVVGSCNLRCPSCAVGNMPAIPKGLMSLEYYEKILEKIKLERPNEKCFIDLYNWGEAVIHLACLKSSSSQSKLVIALGFLLISMCSREWRRS